MFVSVVSRDYREDLLFKIRVHSVFIFFDKDTYLSFYIVNIKRITINIIVNTK